MGFQINQVVVSGNLTRDAETRTTTAGTAVTSLSIAHNERRKNQAGEWEDRAHFFDVTVFGGQGDWLAKNAGKGDPVTVAGQLQWRSWEAQDGSKRSAVEILARDVVLGQRGGGGSIRTADQAAAAISETFGDTRHRAAPAGGAVPPQEDDIPFAPSVI